MAMISTQTLKLVNEYINIVNNALTDGRHKGDGNLYYKHHILPRSLYPDFKHKEWNIVLVTYAEHKRLHEILAECTVSHCQEIMKRDLNYFR